MYGIFVCDCLCNYCFYDLVLITRQCAPLRTLINYLWSCTHGTVSFLACICFAEIPMSVQTVIIVISNLTAAATCCTVSIAHDYCVTDCCMLGIFDWTHRTHMRCCLRSSSSTHDNFLSNTHIAAWLSVVLYSVVVILNSQRYTRLSKIL